MSKIKSFLREESGASMVEYSLLLGIITAAVIGTIVSIGGKVSGAWTTLDTNWK